MTWALLTGDARTCLGELPPTSIQCVVTSPPYWGLRDYGVPGQLGLEPTPDAYVAALGAVFAEVWRVLKDDGTVWLNLGDSYATNRNDHDWLKSGALAKRGWHGGDDLKCKNLIGMPWRVAFALQAAGWYLRSDIIWSKPNPMPESVTDRPTKAHDYLFLLTKAERYYYDAAAIMEPCSENTHGRGPGIGIKNATIAPDGLNRANRSMSAAIINPITMRNKRSVWEIQTEPYPEAHFATFPTALVEPCVLAGSKPGDVILDPFCGSGTVGAVAIGLARQFIGIELNPAYVALARARIGAVAPLFVSESRHPISRGESGKPDLEAKQLSFPLERVGVG